MFRTIVLLLTLLSTSAIGAADKPDSQNATSWPPPKIEKAPDGPKAKAEPEQSNKLSSHETPSVWLDIGKTFVGAFLGAGLAFVSNMLLQYHKRRRRNLAAGLLALTVLSLQLDDFLNVRRGLLAERKKRLGDKIDPKTSGWLNFRPIMYAFSDSLKFDFSSLVFLVEKDTSGVINKLALAEKRYRDLENVLNAFNPNAELIQKRLEDLGVIDIEFHVPTVEKQLGPVLVGKGNSFGNALLFRITHDENDYLSAIDTLRAALTKMYGDEKVPKVELMPGFNVQIPKQ